MEHRLSILLCLLCAGSGHGLRLLHDVDTERGAREFAFGSKAASGAETEPLDPSFDDYENEISRVEFEPELGTSSAAAASPVFAAAAGPAPGPVAAAAAGSGSMKWWLPPSTMPSFPLFPNPGMPGMPGIGMPFRPIGWGAPAPPGQAQPTPPAAADANDKDPNTNEVIN